MALQPVTQVVTELIPGYSQVEGVPEGFAGITVAGASADYWSVWGRTHHTFQVVSKNTAAFSANIEHSVDGKTWKVLASFTNSTPQSFNMAIAYVRFNVVTVAAGDALHVHYTGC